MTAGRNITEYNSLCAVLASLREKFTLRKQECRTVLEKCAAIKRDALLLLAKADAFTRHLTVAQRQRTGLWYQPGELKARIKHFGAACDSIEDAEVPHQAQSDFQPESQPDLRNSRELKQRELLILGMIDAVKKNLLRLDILELRCRELIQSIEKAVEAFRHELKIIRRKIYPFGLFSFFRRSLRRFFGGTYFSFRDLADVAAFGKITAVVLQIADSPVV